MQKLTIRNFGPIKDVELEVNDILIFIGAQATGKSTISKTAYFFRTLRDDFIAEIVEFINSGRVQTTRPLRRRILDEFRWISPLPINADTYICYEYSEHVWIKFCSPKHIKEIKRVKPIDFVQISADFESQYNQIMGDVEKFVQEIKDQESRHFPSLSSSEIANAEMKRVNFTARHTDMVRNLFGDPRDLVFVPASRSVLSDFFSTTKSYPTNALDSLTKDFLRRVETIRPFFSKNFDDPMQIHKENGRYVSNLEQKRLEIAKVIIENILKARFVSSNQDGDTLIPLHDEDSWAVSIKEASSGQQEAVWILLLLFVLLRNGKDAFVTIEEAEAHLYPEAQKDIVELIALLANAGENQVVMTTHSPYILAAWNNLIYAYQIGQERPEETKKIVNEMSWVRPGRVSAYLVEDGTIKSIIDEETRMIEMNAIDRVSVKFIEVFDQLLDLEVESEKDTE